MSGALGDNRSQQYQKDSHKCEDTQKNENGDKGEFADLISPKNCKRELDQF